MFEHNSSEIAEKKIILLYLIDSMNMKLTGLQITKIVMEKGLMDYFSLQQYLGEMSRDGYILVETDSDTEKHQISKKGKQVLEYFQGIIPHYTKEIIDNDVQKIKRQVRTETSIAADYTPQSENEFIVQCVISEDDFKLIDLKVTVGTKQDARTICDNWKQNAQEMYAEIIKCLTKKRNDESL